MMSAHPHLLSDFPSKFLLTLLTIPRKAFFLFDFDMLAYSKV